MAIRGFGNNNNWNNYNKNNKVNINKNIKANNKPTVNSKLNINNLNSIKSDGFVKTNNNTNSVQLSAQPQTKGFWGRFTDNVDAVIKEGSPSANDLYNPTCSMGDKQDYAGGMAITVLAKALWRTIWG